MALADVRLSSRGKVSVPLLSPGNSLPLASTQITVTLYVVPGVRLFTWQRLDPAGQACVMQVPPGGLMGHSLSLNETHCRLAGSMMSTTPLVPLTGSVPLMKVLHM